MVLTREMWAAIKKIKRATEVLEAIPGDNLVAYLASLPAANEAIMAACDSIDKMDCPDNSHRLLAANLLRRIRVKGNSLSIAADGRLQETIEQLITAGAVR